MSLLHRNIWQGRVYSVGWVTGTGATYDAVEPATGNRLARVGAAGRAAAATSAPQWWSTP